MTGVDYLIASLASIVGIGSAFAAIRLPEAAYQWKIADLVFQRWGKNGVRTVYWLVALLMALAVFFIVFPIHRRLTGTQSTRNRHDWIEPSPAWHAASDEHPLRMDLEVLVAIA